MKRGIKGRRFAAGLLAFLMMSQQVMPGIVMAEELLSDGTSTYIEEIVPEGSTRTGSDLEQTVSDETVSENPSGKDGAPEQKVPEEQSREQTATEEHIPGEPASEEQIPGKPASEEQAGAEQTSEQTAPEYDVPEQTATEEHIPDKSVPEKSSGQEQNRGRTSSGDRSAEETEILPEEDLQEDDLLTDGEAELLSELPDVGASESPAGIKVDNIPYIKEDGEPGTAAACTVVDSSLTTWDGEWYVVQGDVTMKSRVTIKKKIKLILEDGATLTVPKGISIGNNTSRELRIYQQSGGTGTLIAGGSCVSGNAGIGGPSGMPSGSIYIHGGNVTAFGGQYAAGIGGGLYSDATFVTVTGGNVTAFGGYGAAGIGGGAYGGFQVLDISGGTVTAQAGEPDPGCSQAPQAIGTGMDPSAGSGDIRFSLYEGAEIHAGNDAYNTEIYSNDEAGIKACHENAYVYICQSKEGVYYIDRAGTEFLLSENIYQRVQPSSEVWDQSWYFASSKITIPDRVRVSGRINLILADNAELTLQKGITVPNGSQLTIFGQRKQKGVLKADASALTDFAGIGGENSDAGTIELCGGNITAEGGDNAPGIGAPEGWNATVILGSQSISDTVVNAVGGNDAAGVGGGNRTKVTIYNGNVTAEGKGGGAGIGGNNTRSFDTISIRGGMITAKGGTSGAGIGSGANGTGGDIQIHGGEVYASGTDTGAGIGGGLNGCVGSVYIEEAVIEATGGKEGASGIGNGNGGNGGRLEIRSGLVLSTGGGSYAAFGRADNDSFSIAFGDIRLQSGDIRDSLKPVTVLDGKDLRRQECKKHCVLAEECTEHAADPVYLSDPGSHWNICSYCSARINVEKHDYKEYDKKDAAEYYPYEEDPDDHEYHRRECKVCGYCERGFHEYESDSVNCILCGKGMLSITYVDENGELKHHMGGQMIHEKTDAESETSTLYGELFDGFYTFEGWTTIEQRIEVEGNVNLVLRDGAVLEAKKGIHVDPYGSLTIWRQEKGSGQLMCTGHDRAAGIGGDEMDTGGSITINGGSISAKGGYGAAGIGSGSFADDEVTVKYIQGTDIPIYYTNVCGPKISINGGEIEAVGGYRAAAIGGGTHCSGGETLITGGTVKAESDQSAGIGGGFLGHGGTIKITGGRVNAYSNFNGAAIGGGFQGAYDIFKGYTNITITKGARVYAESYDSTGIGLGNGLKRPWEIDCKINLLGGQVTAKSIHCCAIGYRECEIQKITIDDVFYKSKIFVTVDMNDLADSVTFEGSAFSEGNRDDFDQWQRDRNISVRFTKTYTAKGTQDTYPIKGKNVDGHICTWTLMNKTFIPFLAVPVVFDSNGAAGSMENTAVKDGRDYYLPQCGFKAPYGKYFAGWKSSEDNKIYQPNDKYNTHGKDHNYNDVVFTAQWEKGYSVWVGHILITPLNCEDVFGNRAVSYDPDTYTLRLDHVKELTPDPYLEETVTPPNIPSFIYAEEHDLNIEFDEANIFGSKDLDGGIVVTDGSLTIRPLSGARNPKLNIRASRFGIFANKNLTIQDVENLKITASNPQGRGIYADGYFMIEKKNAPASVKCSGHIEGGSGIYAKSTWVTDIYYLSVKATNRNGYGILTRDLNVERKTSYTCVDVTGGRSGIESTSTSGNSGGTIYVKDAEVKAYGWETAIRFDRNMRIRRTEPWTYVRADSEGTGIYGEGILICENADIESSGGEYGIHVNSGFLVRWPDRDLDDIEVSATGGKEAVSGHVDLDPGLMIREPENARRDSNNNIVTEDGQKATEVLIAPKQITLSFDPGTGSGFMAPLTLLYDQKWFLPSCSFNPPEPDVEFAGWKINGVMYENWDDIWLTEDSVAVAQWGFNWFTLKNLIRDGTRLITLPCDVKAEGADTQIDVLKDVVIDLNGHTIDRNAQEPKKDGGVFHIQGGNLTIMDSKGGGCIKGANYQGNGGAVIISSGSFTLEGGEISGNSSTQGGAGVFASNGTFFHMNGGTITRNTTGYGVAVLIAGATFSVSGSPVIMGNTSSFTAASPNYDLNFASIYGQTYHVINVTGPLTKDAKISLGSYKNRYMVLTKGLPGNGVPENFISEDPKYGVGLNAEGEAELKPLNTVTFYADPEGKQILYQDERSGGASLSDLSGLTTSADGLVFAGWTDKASGPEGYSYRAAIPGEKEYCLVDLGMRKMAESDCGFYPVFTRPCVQVHLDLDAYDANATKENYNDWTYAPVYRDTGTPAYMAESQYRCFLVDLGETVPMNQGMNSAIRTGYVLTYWHTQDGIRWTEAWTADPRYCNKDAMGNPHLTQDPDKPYAYYTLTLTAGWTFRQAEIGYSAGEGTGMFNNTVVKPFETVKINSVRPIPPEGKVFTGWTDRLGVLHKASSEFTYETLDVCDELGSTKSARNTICFSAVYEERPEGALQFDTQGGTAVTSIEKGASATDTYYYVYENEVKEKTTVRTGYKFAGWVTSPGGTEKVQFPIRIEGNKNVTIYASWEPAEFSIMLDFGSDAALAFVRLKYGEPVSVNVPEKEHYRFDGWVPALPVTMPADNLKVRATWVPITYRISFDSAGGSKVNPIEGAYGAKVRTPEIPRRDGYSFVRWQPALPASMPDTNPTLTAVWIMTQETPPAPEVITFTDTSIEVKTDEGQEYSIDGAKTWQTSGVFSGLTPATLYSIVTRKAPTAAMLPSDASGPTKQMTDKSRQDPPDAPVLVPGLTTMEVSPAYDGLEYRIEEAGIQTEDPSGSTAAWIRPDQSGKMVFTGLKPDTPYSVTARMAETDIAHASEPSQAAEDYTLKRKVELVRLSGIARYQETLKASVIPADTEDLSVQWYRLDEEGGRTAISGAAGYTLLLGADDIGKRVQVEVVQVVRDPEEEDVTVSAVTGTIRKAPGPGEPQVEASASQTVVTVTSPVDPSGRYEYSLDNEYWQSSPEFRNLSPGTLYTVYAREKETATYYAGKSGSASVTTDKTVSDVYLVYQSEDGSWTEQNEDGSWTIEEAVKYAGKAESRYLLPEDPVHFRAAGYRLDNYAPTDAGAIPCSAASNIVLPADTSALYIYYQRMTYDLVFFRDIEGKQEMARYQVYYDAPLESFQDVSLAREGYSMEGWSFLPFVPKQGRAEYDWHAADRSDEEHCVVEDLAVEKMPDKEIDLYPVLIRHRVEVRLDTGAFDKNADAANMNGWVNPRKYEEDETAVLMDARQLRSFDIGAGDVIDMTGMDAAQRAGYTNGGWYTESGIQWNGTMGSDPEYCDRDAQGDPILTRHAEKPYSYYTLTLTAVWYLNWADVEYYSSQSTEPVESEKCIPYGRVNITDLIPEAPEGVGFVGWIAHNSQIFTKGQSFGYYDLKKVNKLGTDGSSNVIRLDAQYIPLQNGVLYFDTQGGTNVDFIQRDIPADSDHYTVDAPEILSRTTEREGYSFAGWALDADGKNMITETSPSIHVLKEGATVFAIWKAEEYQVTFDSKGGVFTDDSGVLTTGVLTKQVGYGQPIEAPSPDPVREHYTFDGWRPAIEAQAVMPAHDLLYEAVWKPKKYRIEFDLDGGKPAIDPIEAVYGARLTPPADPARDGYVFAGWEPAFPLHMPDAETGTVLKAQWKQLQDKPDPPRIMEVGDTYLRVLKRMGHEYSIDGGNTWSKQGVFTGLTPGKPYRIVARMAAGKTKTASEISEPTEQTTRKSYQETPNPPSTKAGFDFIEITPVTSGQEYSLDGTSWKSPDDKGRVVFEGLTRDTRYEAYARWAETEVQQPSEPSDPSVVYTGKQRLESLSITGEPVYGEELKAVVSPSDIQDVTYQWYRIDPERLMAHEEDYGEAIRDATNPVYKVNSADMGKELRLAVSQTFSDGEELIILANVGPAEKMDGPAAPAIQTSSDETGITVIEPVQSGSRYEYSLDGKTWQTDPVFRGLTPGNPYTVYARVKETLFRKAGETGSLKTAAASVVAEISLVYQNADGTWTVEKETVPESDIPVVGISASAGTAENTYTLPSDQENFKVSGYSFNYFEPTEEGRTEAAAGEKLTLPVGTDEVFVYFERDRYMLVFYEDQEGRTVMDSYPVFYGASLTPYAAEKTAKDNCSFGGWTDKPKKDGDYEYRDIVPGTSGYIKVDLDKMNMPGEDLILYPIFIPYRVRIHLDVGVLDKNATDTNMNGWVNPIVYPEDGTPAEMEESQYRSFTTNSGEKLQMEKMNKVTRPGYLLEGWFTTDGIRWEDEFGTSEKYGDKNDDGVAYVSSMEEGYYDFYTLTLTAHWKPQEIPVTYGGAAADDKTSLGQIVELPEPDPSAEKDRRLARWEDKTGAFHAPGEHFLFNDWTLTENNELPFTAVYEEIPQYGVIFDPKGGSYVPTEIVPEGGSVSRPQDPTRAGYLFAGWYLDDQEVTFPIQDIRSAITLRAKWDRRTFTIVFDTNGGEEIVPLILKYEDKVSVPDPVRKGYNFEKWSPELPEIMPAYDLKVEAIWSPVPEPTVTPVPDETITPTVTVTPVPDETITPTVTPVPDETITPTVTPGSDETITPTPTVTPVPDETITPTVTPGPDETITPTVTPGPDETITPTPTVTPRPDETITPTVTPEPDVTVTPVPDETITPTVTPGPDETITPTVTPVPDETITPTVTPEPDVTVTPESDVTPTDVPEPTDTPEPTDAPDPSESPDPGVTPDVSETPSGTPVPIVTQSGGSGGYYYGSGGTYSGNSAEYHSDGQPQKPDADTGDHTATSFWVMILAASMLLTMAAGFIFKKTINK